MQIVTRDYQGHAIDEPGSLRLKLLNCEKFAVVDSDTAPEILRCPWRVDRGYVVAGGSRILHRVIIKPPKGLVVDHIDRDPLNNRRTNLRVVTPAENRRNQGQRRIATSRFRGVARDTKSGKWQVYFNRSYVGLYADEIDAGWAWINVAEKAYGLVNVAKDKAFLVAASEGRVSPGIEGRSLA